MTDKPKAKFRDQPLRAIERHLLCQQQACDGEMRSTGQGTHLGGWQHRCDKCGAEAWTLHSYPSVVHIPATAGE